MSCQAEVSSDSVLVTGVKERVSVFRHLTHLGKSFDLVSALLGAQLREQVLVGCLVVVVALECFLETGKGSVALVGVVQKDVLCLIQGAFSKLLYVLSLEMVNE